MATCKVCGYLVVDPGRPRPFGGMVCQCGSGEPIPWEDKETIDDLDLPPPERPDRE